MTIHVLPHLSPRIVRVPISDGTELTAQQLIDQLRTFEERPDSQSYPLFIKAEGKGDLGGGLLIGITATLQDAQIEFEERVTPASSGTATSGGGSTTLNDTAATFITDGVVRGAWIVNFTDQSVATVRTVDSEIKLTTTPLVEGTGNTYDNLDVYKVWNITQIDVSGGNVIAIDSAGSELTPVFTSFGVQVIKTASVSATLQEQADIEYSSFDHGVSIDVLSSNSGIIFPTGTPRQPVNNLVDAITIANTRGFIRLFIHGDLTVGATENIDGFELVGDEVAKTKITVTAGASTVKSEFTRCTLTGDVSGAIAVREAILDNIDNIGSTVTDIIFETCLVNLATYQFLSSGTKKIVFSNSASGIGGHGGPTLDFNGAASTLVVADWHGGLKLAGITQGMHTINISSGHITVEASCTAGTLVVHGVTMFDDNSTGTFIFDTSGIVNEDTIADQVWAEVIDSVFTAQEIMRLVASAAAAKLSGAATTTISIRDLGDTKDRVVATVDSDGNRTAVTLDAT